MEENMNFLLNHLNERIAILDNDVRYECQKIDRRYLESWLKETDKYLKELISEFDNSKGCICDKETVSEWRDGKCFECNRELSEKDFRELGLELQIEELQRRRNILNRRISTLKKASPKKENCVNCKKDIPVKKYPFCSDKCQDEAHEKYERNEMSSQD